MLLLLPGSAVGYEWFAWRLGLTPVVVMNAVFLGLVFIETGLKAKRDGLLPAKLFRI